MMKNKRIAIVCVACCVGFALSPNAIAGLINVGDSQMFCIHSWISGDPTQFPNQAVPVPVTAGTYKFYLEDSYWNISMGRSYNNVVGGVWLATSNGTCVMREPMADGTNPNNTVRTLYFDVQTNQTLLAGVADNIVYDNVGDAVFTLTKIAEIPEPATLLLLGLGGLTMIRKRK